MIQKFKFSFLSSNAIKILGAIFMVLDHIGVILFPKIEIFRILGRLAMPLFAYAIAEGAYYTKHKLKYFLLIFVLGSAFQAVYYVVEKSFYMGILITFSTAILLIYALQFLQTAIFYKKTIQAVFAFLIFSSLIVGTFFLNKHVVVDYGFWGCLLPVFASLFRLKTKDKKINNHLINLLCFAVGLFLVYVSLKGRQQYSFYSLIILLFYSGKRGKLNLKYFFYIFYPLHMVILYGISMLMQKI